MWRSFLGAVGSSALDFRVVLVGARMLRELYQIARKVGVEQQLDAQKARTVRLVVQKKGWLIDQMSDYFTAFEEINKREYADIMTYAVFDKEPEPEKNALREARKTMALFGNNNDGLLDFRGQCMPHQPTTFDCCDNHAPPLKTTPSQHVPAAAAPLPHAFSLRPKT